MTKNKIIPHTVPWYEIRRHRFCASDVGPAFGYSKFKAPIDVVLEKRGKVPKETEAMRRGILLENACRLALSYKLITHVREERFVQGNIWFMSATVDGEIDDTTDAEIKTHLGYMASNYGPEGSDHIPYSELLQCHHSLACTGKQKMVVAVLFADQMTFDLMCHLIEALRLTNQELSGFIQPQLKIYIVHRNELLIKRLIEKEEAWWKAYILDGNDPPPDGSEMFRKYIEELYPRETEPARTCTVDEHLIHQRMSEAKAKADMASKEYNKLCQELMVSMGASAGLLNGDNRSIASYKVQKSGKRIFRPKYPGEE